MNIRNYFQSQNRKTARVAKERLQIIVAHERSPRGGPDYLPLLKEELLLVVRKYVQVDPGAVTVQLDREGDCDVLELNVILPEPESGERSRKT